MIGNYSLQKPMGERASLIFLAVLPVAVWFTNSNVLGNANGDVDTWFYFGHFMAIGKYDVSNIIGRDYYETRLPFILPGCLLFQLLPLTWAKMAFAYLIYATTLSSLFYTLRAYMPHRTAALVLMLLASDIFFVRAMGWNYVDAGVIVYQSLTLASLTAARSSSRRLLWVGIAAFFFTCSIFCHLGVVLSIFPIAIYAWLCLDPANLSRREIRNLVYAAITGVIVCQVFFGLLNAWINGRDFFFILLLFNIAIGETHSSQVGQQSPWELLRDYGWLTLPFAIWIASGIALVLGLLNRVKLDRTRTAMFLMTFLICSVLWLLDELQFSYYLARAGMYVSLYLPICYLGIAALLMRAPQPTAAATLAIGSVFLFSLLIRLHYQGATPPWLPQIGGVWLAGAALGLLLSCAYLVPGRVLKAAILCFAAVPTLFVSWRFEDTRDAYASFMVLREMAGNELPYIWTRHDDPLYRTVILPVISSFTERGWWIHGEDFPNDPMDAWQDEKVFVVSSTMRSLAEAQKLAATRVERIEPVRSRLIHLSQGDLWIGEFRASNTMAVLGRFPPALLKKGKIPAADMYSLNGTTQGEARVASEGSRGTLMYGPYISLAPGRYKFTIVYGPVSGNQEWDICSQQNDRATTIVSGKFPSTNRRDGHITRILQFDKKVVGLEIRAFYSGAGRLTVRYVGITPLPS
ncbi:MAG TPA: hypothetical protein VG891_13060 [Rhizomicrobium sp.]|nr:hypothetical protein [Rhizomicrobium sp.]